MNVVKKNVLVVLIGFCLSLSLQSQVNSKAKVVKGKLVDVSKKPIKAFILLGQSNMVGFAKQSEYHEEYQQVISNPNVLRLTPEGWTETQFQFKNGPEISFAYEMSRAFPGETIGIIKVAIGGTGIRAFLPEWNQKLAGKDARKGPIYKDQILIAIQKAKQTCPQIEFAGVLWKQGGADMKKKELAKGYNDCLGLIISELRKDTGVKDLPLFVSTYASLVEVKKVKADPTSYPKPKRVAAWDVIEAHNKAQDEIPFTRVVVHGALPCIADGIHFNTAGQTTLGKMYAEEYLKYTKINK